MTAPTTPDVPGVLAGILADPEFEPDWHDQLGEWGRRFGHWVERWLSGLSPQTRWLLVALGAGILAGFVYTLFIDYVRVAPATSPRAAAAPHAEEAADLFAVARALAAAGRLREAARALQQAVYRGLAERRGTAWEPSRADWEWVSTLGSGAELVAFTSLAQALAYGTAASESASAIERLWAEGQALVRGQP